MFHASYRSDSEDSDLDVNYLQSQNTNVKKKVLVTGRASLKYKVTEKELLFQKNAIIQQLTNHVAAERAEYLSQTETLQRKFEEQTNKIQLLIKQHQREINVLTTQNLEFQETIKNVKIIKEKYYHIISSQKEQIESEKNKSYQYLHQIRLLNEDISHIAEILEIYNYKPLHGIIDITFKLQKQKLKLEQKQYEIEILQKSTNDSITEMKSLENMNKKLHKEYEREVALLTKQNVSNIVTYNVKIHKLTKEKGEYLQIIDSEKNKSHKYLHQIHELNENISHIAEILEIENYVSLCDIISILNEQKFGLDQKRKEVEILRKNSQIERDEMENKAFMQQKEIEILRDNSEFIFLWKWKDDKNKWMSYDPKINKQINKLSLNKSLEYKLEKNHYVYNYSITKTSNKAGFQMNLKTKKKREIKREKHVIDALIEEKENLLERIEDIGYIVQWQWNETIESKTKSEWISYPDEINTKLQELEIGTSFYYDCKQNNQQYKIYKVTKDTALQTNVETKMQRACRRYRKKVETLLKEAEEKENEYVELQQKVGYQVLWEWYDTSKKMWLQCSKKKNDRLEKLSVNEETTFMSTAGVCKIKRSTDTAVQSEQSTEWSFRRIEKASGFNHIEFPEWWHYTHSRASKTKFIGYTAPNLVSLSCYTGLEKVRVTDLFNKTAGSKFEILDIDGVKNEMLWDKYQNEKKSLIKAIGVANINEQYLFHGSQTISTLDNILTQGFRPEFNRRGAYGKGVYFAKHAIYSTKYAAKCVNFNILVYKMLCCKVMTGESTNGTAKYELTNWPKKSNGQIFDSLVNSLSDLSIFAIHENCRAYPLYVIRYKKK